MARLCPWLQDVSCRADDGAGLADALQGLERVAGTLNELRLYVDESNFIEPCATLRAAEALGRLSGLGLIVIFLDFPSSHAWMFGTALSSLTSLSLLEVTGELWKNPPPQQLGVWPGSLREVTLECPRLLGGLRALPHMGGVTKLKIEG